MFMFLFPFVDGFRFLCKSHAKNITAVEEADEPDD
jgi:hypothetical protein